MHKLLLILLAASSLMLTGCEVGIPKGITPVKDFDAQRYLGDWFEIARLEHSHEKGLSNITANYSLREDGGIRVLNRGYDPEKKEWRTAEGKAYFVESPDIGYLKVSSLVRFTVRTWCLTWMKPPTSIPTSPDRIAGICGFFPGRRTSTTQH